uniref:Uncharacterized protein n=1 Tax=Dunaliella tertiolecta TaxID=3047 RepID=A0A7S3R3Q9_DUNTE|mmetsp:Transcript_6465/g.17294  ORF Transcript_6465/g.17294 Transcript_6465/m.17294 type:complete len:804 (+) Transcript_6465:161-2572(+)
MFWKVAGFSQPSPIEQILDKQEFTLEELLDEEDMIQECKSLNGRLVAFLRERSTVEQLIRYIVDPPADSDDPKRLFQYPFTACEVFCCEVEAVFNTLLWDEGLMALLFSFLDSPAPLSSRTAGYFGRVVSNLLLRKTNEAMQYLQANQGVLHKLAKHVGTTSVAEILKRLVGGDEQSSMLFLPQYAQWLAETPLVDLLLAQLSADSSADAQANAADILSSIAHTQPSALASKLTSTDSITALFSHALAPSHHLLVPALDVCIALVEPKRCAQAPDEAPFQEAIIRAKLEAVDAIMQHLPSLIRLLADAGDKLAVAPAETPYGLLHPPLGRARLKIVDLLAVLFRSGSTGIEPVMMELEAVQLCCRLFCTYPFNNLLHHCVTALLVAAITRCSENMLRHVFEHCKLLDWITSLQVEVRPTPLPGQEELAGSKPSIRAGYMGHVTQLASTLESFAQQPQSSSSSDTGQDNSGAGEAAAAVASASPACRNSVLQYLEGHAGWHNYVEQQLHYQQELENTSRWACGRPIAAQLAGLDSDGDDFQADMDLENMVGMQPALYHRYNVDENEEEEDEDNEPFKATFNADSFHNTQLITEAMGNIDINDSNPWHDPSVSDEQHNEFYDSKDEGEGMQEQDAENRSQGMEDDEVLLATSDDDDLPERLSSPSKAFQANEEARAQGGEASRQGESYEDKQPGEDMVMIGGEEASQPSFSHRDSQPPPQQEQPQPSRPSEPPHAQERQGSGEASGQEGGSTGSEAVGRTGQQHVAPEAQADGSEVGEKGGTNTESSSQEGQANPAQAESHEGTG